MQKTKFSELSEERQWEIVETSIEDWWADCLLEEMQQELEQLGFTEPKISFSGFWSQGDGASFTCKSVDLTLLVQATGFKTQLQKKWEESTATLDPAQLEFLRSLYLVDARPSRLVELLDQGLIQAWVTRDSNHYVHERTTSLEWETQSYDLVEEEHRFVAGHEICDQDAQELEEFIQYLDSKQFREWLVDLNKSMYDRLYEQWEAARDAEHEHLLDMDDEYKTA